MAASKIGRAIRLPRPWLLGLGVPLLLGLALAFGAFISWVSGGYERPREFEAGRIDEFEVASPRYFEEERVWLVRLDSGEFLALYDRDTQSGCSVPWRPQHEFMGRKGWFRDACRGSLYDVTGRCFDGPCSRGLDRFAVQIAEGEVVVDLTDLAPGPPVDFEAEPVSPP